MKKLHLILILFCSFLLILSGCESRKPPEPPDPLVSTVNNDSYTLSGKNYAYAIYNEESRLLTHPLMQLHSEVKRRADMGLLPISDIYILSHGWNYTVTEAVANYHNYIELIDEKACGFTIKFVKNRQEQQKEIQLFESEKRQCAVLVVKSANEPTKLTTARFKNNRFFKDEFDVMPFSKLSVELKKGEGNRREILKLLADWLGHTLPEGMDDPLFQPYFIFVTWTSTVRPLSNIATAAENQGNGAIAK